MPGITGIAGIAAGAAAITLPAGQIGNAVIIDGAISATPSSSGPDSYSLTVSAAGAVTLYDNNTGNSQSVSGATYLVFDGAAVGSNGAYQQSYIVANGLNAEIAEMYNSALGREPDFAGLEYYAIPTASGAQSLHQDATFFLASPEFAKLYPALTAPADNGGPNDQAFITELYGNILHRAASAAEVNYYVDALQGTLTNSSGAAVPAVDRAQLLIYFSISPENQKDVSASNGGWLINSDSGAVSLGTPAPGSVAAATELNVSAGGTIDTAAISSASMTGTINVNGGVSGGGVSLVSGAPGSIWSGEAGITIDLSSNVNQAEIYTISGDTIYTGTDGHFYMITYGLGGNTLHLSGSNTALVDTNVNGNSPTTVHAAAVAQTVYGFAAGDSISFGRVGGGVMDIISTVPTTPIQGTSLIATNAAPGAANFGNDTIIINVGNVTDSSAAAMAVAAAKVYTPTTTSYGDSSHGAESVIFYGEGANNDTVIYKWFADATHTVSAATMVGGVDLIGVNSSHLIANSGSSLSIS